MKTKIPSSGKPRPAKIIKISQKTTAEVVVVQELKSKEQHNFITGSINGVRSDVKKVGQKGVIEWHIGPGYYLPFFCVYTERD